MPADDSILQKIKFSSWAIALRQMRKSLLDCVPALRLKLSKQNRQALVDEFQHCTTVENCIAFTQKHMGGGSIQIPWEIESALNLIAESKPTTLCEIGTFEGGTSLLLSRFLPTLQLILCIDLFVKNKAILNLLESPGQTHVYFDMPSFDDSTVKKVRNSLNGREIDVLFIDGDHRYEGVKNDFLQYHSMVREGGLILLHDIQNSEGSERAWAGGVPKFWKELSGIYPGREFIHSPEQHGFGIGIITYSKKTELPAGFSTVS